MSCIVVSAAWRRVNMLVCGYRKRKIEMTNLTDVSDIKIDRIYIYISVDLRMMMTTTTTMAMTKTGISIAYIHPLYGHIVIGSAHGAWGEPLERDSKTRTNIENAGTIK